MTRWAILPLLLLACGASAPPAIHLDQLGYLPGATKRAVVADATTAPLRWELLDARGIVTASGSTTVAGDDAQSGDHVHLVDFSAVRAPGRYRLRVDGVTSPDFMIGPGTFAPLAKASLNYFYQTRAGVPIEARFAGGVQWARAAGHPDEVAPCISGRDLHGNDWPGCGYSLDVTGGWYDAGDQGKYVVNGGIALWTLQNLYETGPGRALFPDGAAKLPEAGNGINDLLDEARWELQFLLKMQVPAGTHLRLPVGDQTDGPLRFTDVDAGGMAHHKVADRNWTPIPTAPADDPQPRLLYPPSTGATLNLAAVAAQGARIWRGLDPAFARTCLQAALRAWDAARRNPAIYANEAAFPGSGGYGDRDLSDETYWAAAELLATTHEPRFADVVRESRYFTAKVDQPGWAETAALGTITLATVSGALPSAEQAGQQRLIVAAADRFLAEEPHSGYRLPYASTSVTWGSNSILLNRAMLMALAASLTGEPRYRDGVVDVMDYVLGRNPLDQSFITGFGWRPMQNPHHRFWAHSIDARYPGPPPGVIGGGPNNVAMADDVAKTLKGRCAPLRCWADKTYAYALNEVAINWNAPLVWVSTWLTAAPAQPRPSIAAR